MSNNISFNVRGTNITTCKDHLKELPYFTNMLDHNGTFLDFDPKAFHSVINYLTFMGYNIPLKHLYLFDFLGIKYGHSNLYDKPSKKCLSCGSLFEILNYENNNYCSFCSCIVCDCENSRMNGYEYCEDHSCSVLNCREIVICGSVYCLLHQ